MPNDNPEIVSIEVFHVSRPEIDLAKEYKRVSEELSWLKKEFTEAGDPILAGQIVIEQFGVNVRYNPSPPRSVNAPEPKSGELETDFKFLYGAYGEPPERVGRAFAMQGLQDFTITSDGELGVSKWTAQEDGRKRFYWTPRQPAFASQLNEALNGLVEQHNKLMAHRLAHSVAGAVVPSLTEA